MAYSYQQMYSAAACLGHYGKESSSIPMSNKGLPY